jgi:hypothetical protein
MTRIRFGRSGATSPPSQPGDTGLPCAAESTPLRDTSAECRRPPEWHLHRISTSSGETPAKAPVRESLWQRLEGSAAQIQFCARSRLCPAFWCVIRCAVLMPYPRLPVSSPGSRRAGRSSSCGRARSGPRHRLLRTGRVGCQRQAQRLWLRRRGRRRVSRGIRRGARHRHAYRHGARRGPEVENSRLISSARLARPTTSASIPTVSSKR